MTVNCGHGLGICARCQDALDELQALCADLGLDLDVVYVVGTTP